MKKILFIIQIIFLSVSFQSIIKADDIKDFEIEGMSIGDSLLKFANEEKIRLSISNQKYPNDKFTIYEADQLVLNKKYDYLTVTTKKNDKKYVITSISGSINYHELDDCLKKKISIQNEIEKIINFNEKEEVEYPAKKDKTGNSIIYGIQYYLKPPPSNEAILINCYHYTEELGVNRNLTISVNKEEFAYFLINEAYK
jgi:hypothetical protein